MEVFVSATPLATHIFRLRHMAAFGDASVAEIDDLARVLRNLLAKRDVGLESPDLNFTVRSVLPIAPAPGYVSVIPRLIRAAGFELGSGMSSTGFCPKRSRNFFVT